MLIFSLTGCGSSKQEDSANQDDIVGTWKCSITSEDGTSEEFALSFEADGTYSYEAYMDGIDGLAASDNGTYEMQGEKLILHSSVDNEDKECTVSGNKLVFFDNEYTKAE